MKEYRVATEEGVIKDNYHYCVYYDPDPSKPLELRKIGEDKAITVIDKTPENLKILGLDTVKFLPYIHEIAIPDSIMDKWVFPKVITLDFKDDPAAWQMYMTYRVNHPELSTAGACKKFHAETGRGKLSEG